MSDIQKEEWYYEYSHLPVYSPSGHFTIKINPGGAPIAILPVPIGGGIKGREKQEARAQWIVEAKYESLG